MMTSSDTRPWYETAFKADYIQRYTHRSETEARQAVDLILDHIPLHRDNLVLDLCCGAGRHSLAFCQAGYRVIGLDLSMELLREASSRPCDHVQGYTRGDMRHLPFANSSFFSVVHLFTAFGYFQEDQENESVFTEIRRILESGGYYFFDFLNAHRVVADLSSGPVINLEEKGSESIHSVKALSEDRKRVHKSITVTNVETGESFEITEDVRLFQASELREMFARNGFQIIREFGEYSGKDFKADWSNRYMALLKLA